MEEHQDEPVASREVTVNPPSRAATGHVAALDGLRGLAILVVLVHNVGYFDEPVDSPWIKLIRVAFGGGWVGVQLFFVLSGFLITGILLDSRHRPHYFRSFYIRRVLRIFPLYYITLVGAFLVLPHIVDLGEWGARAVHVQVWYWTYLSNWSDPITGTLPGLSHFWSLAVEEQFYFVWPLVVLRLSADRLVHVCGFLIVSALIVRVGLVRVGAPTTMPYNFTIARWDALACGAAVAIALRDPRWYDRIAARLRRYALPLVALLLVVTIVQRGLGPLTPLSLTVGQSAAALMFGLLVLDVVDTSHDAGWLRRATEARWLRFFGKYSYGLYVVHPPIHRLLTHWLAPWIIGGTRATRPGHLLAYVALNLAASTVAAVAVWHLVERRFLALKDVLAPRV